MRQRGLLEKALGERTLGLKVFNFPCTVISDFPFLSPTLPPTINHCFGETTGLITQQKRIKITTLEDGTVLARDSYWPPGGDLPPRIILTEP